MHISLTKLIHQQGFGRDLCIVRCDVFDREYDRRFLLPRVSITPNEMEFKTRRDGKG
jgi:hypothetical protein